MTESSHSYAGTPTAVVYDIFAETANRLVGEYVRRLDDAPDAFERERWWNMTLKVRDARRAVEPYDRTQLIEHIDRWSAELRSLEASE